MVNTIYQSPMKDNLSDLSKDVHLVAIERTGIPVPPRFFSTVNQVLTKIQIFWSLTPPHITPVSPIDLKIRMRRWPSPPRLPGLSSAPAARMKLPRGETLLKHHNRWLLHRIFDRSPSTACSTPGFPPPRSLLPSRKLRRGLVFRPVRVATAATRLSCFRHTAGRPALRGIPWKTSYLRLRA
jgi:hypothetical protein